MADKTRRWFADNSVSYALGALALFDHARVNHRSRFVYGPLDMQAMTDSGLEVSGSEEDLNEVAVVLSVVPGLVEYQPD